MAHWLLKTEPDEFSFADLQAAGARGETWDGIRNHQAAGYLRQMQRGDTCLVYHTGKEKQVVGLAEVQGAAFADPKDESGRFVAVKLRAGAALTRPVTLAAIKAEPGLASCVLLRQARLSVMPITDDEWRLILALGRG